MCIRDRVSLVQGTGIRGQFEERMQKLMEEIRKREDIILFIDEIHEIVGAGSAGDGNMDAGNILKPALARGELQLVGATTVSYTHLDVYKRQLLYQKITRHPNTSCLMDPIVSDYRVH